MTTLGEYEEYLNEMGIPDRDLKSHGGRVPDGCKYGSWMRRNDKIAFNYGYYEYNLQSVPR